MGTGTTKEKNVPTLWSLSKYNHPNIEIQIKSTQKDSLWDVIHLPRLCSPPNSWLMTRSTWKRNAKTNLFQPPSFHRSSFPSSEHWPHPPDLAAEILYQSGVARQCKNEVKKTFASNAPIRRDFSAWRRKFGVVSWKVLWNPWSPWWKQLFV